MRPATSGVVAAAAAALMPRAGSRAVVQGYQEAWLSVCFGTGLGEAVVGVQSFVSTYPVRYGAKRLPHFPVSGGARQLALVVQTAAIQLWEGGAAASDSQHGAHWALGAPTRGPPRGPDEAVGAGGLAEGFDQLVARPGVQAAGGRRVGEAVGVAVQRETVLGEGSQRGLQGQRGLFQDPRVQGQVVLARGRRFQIQKV